MAAPAFLGSSYFYFERSNVTDVQTIMDDFEDEVLANSPVWTKPTAATLYVSPVDGDGRFFDVELARIDQYTLSLALRDQNAVTIMTRRIVIPSANGVMVRIYTGQFHFCIDVECYSAAPEYFWGGILDLSPESQVAHSQYVWGWGSCSTASVHAEGYFEYVYMFDNAAPASVRRINQYCCGVAGRYRPQFDLMGYRPFYPLLFYAQPAGGGDYRYAGRAYQQLLVPEDAGQPGAEIVLPVDAAVNGTFRMLSGLVDTEPSATGGKAYRVAIRVA
jgi:hypothetical protein